MVIGIRFCEVDFSLDDFENYVWLSCEQVLLNKYWSGENAPPERGAVARLLWTDAALYVRFDCRQSEPFVVKDQPDATKEAEKLWERDVCEIFVAPNADQPEKYFEFEVAPTGEWLDYAVHQMLDRRETDAAYSSGIKTAAQISENGFSVIFCVEWQAFGKKPLLNEEWRGNLFRCVGAGAARGYLAWQPTLTEQPNFHVPSAFGYLKFI